MSFGHSAEVYQKLNKTGPMRSFLYGIMENMVISPGTKQILKKFFGLCLVVSVGYANYRWPFYKYFSDIWWTLWAWIGSWLFLVLILKAFFDSLLISLVKQKRGEKGERDIKNILKKLPKSYIYLQNINLAKRGNIDFVLAGPTGIMTIEVKSHAGIITFDGRELKRDGKPLEKDFLGQAWSEKCLVRDALKQGLGRNFEVQPIIVFSNQNAEIKLGQNPINGVYVMDSSELKKFVLSGENTPKLKEEDIKIIANIIKESHVKY